MKNDETLKKELCNELVKNSLCKEGDVIKHSFTAQIMEGNKKCVEKSDGIMITLTTRPDCVGVCVNDKVKLLGGIGEKKSNNGTQWYEQNRIYDSETVATATPTEFHPNYAIQERERDCMNNLRIRKLTPTECMRLMAFEKKDTESMRQIGMSDSQIYHCAGDSIVSSCLIGIFGELLGIDTTKAIEDYAERLANE